MDGSIASYSYPIQEFVRARPRRDDPTAAGPFKKIPIILAIVEKDSSARRVDLPSAGGTGGTLSITYPQIMCDTRTV